jgi:hypothetical protein
MSVIDIRLWDAAGWKGTGFGFRQDGEGLPFIGLHFANPEAGRAIFESWRERFGDVDEYEELRVSIIEGDVPGQRAGYTVHITGDPRNILARAKHDGYEIHSHQILTISRSRRMSPGPGSPYLADFKRAYPDKRQYMIMPVEEQDGAPTPRWELGIQKKVIYFRRVEDVSPDDIDSSVLPPDHPR